MNVPYCMLQVGLGVTVLLNRSGFFDFHQSVQYLLVKSSNKITSDHYSSWKFLHCMLKAVEVPLFHVPYSYPGKGGAERWMCKHWQGGVWGHAHLENCRVFMSFVVWSGYVPKRKSKVLWEEKKNLWTKMPRSEGAPPAPPPAWSLLPPPPPPPLSLLPHRMKGTRRMAAIM